MPLDRSDTLAIDDLVFFGTPESSDESFILWIVLDVHLALLVVLKLRMVNSFLRDSCASEKPNTINVKIGFLTENKMSCESMLSESVESLKEILAEVLSLVHDLTFTLILVVVQEPYGIACWIENFLKLISSCTRLVLMVHVESLEVEKIKS